MVCYIQYSFLRLICCSTTISRRTCTVCLLPFTEVKRGGPEPDLCRGDTGDAAAAATEGAGFFSVRVAAKVVCWNSALGRWSGDGNEVKLGRRLGDELAAAVVAER